jgi:PTH1 family peptidyl-tRNA hydrolase
MSSAPREDEASNPHHKKSSRRKHQEKVRRISLSGQFDYDANSSSVLNTSSLLISSSRLLGMAAPIRLLVCSIGNPGPYLSTLHSAGHTVLDALARSLSYSSFQKSRAYGNGLVSAGSNYTLWQSTSLMNVSGVGVAAAWRQFQKEGRGEQAKLIVVHDELELAVGVVKVKEGSASAKGHNGLKSINGLIKGADYTRIGIGIGRPESRDPNVVAGYVLRRMTGQEKAKIESCVGRVEMELTRLMEG